MKALRPVITALIAIFFYTLTDILIWQRIFEANQMIEFADTYHTGWFVTLAGYGFLGVFLLWDSWRDCLYYIVALFVGAFSGLEDALYYVFDRKPIPDSLPWLDSNPMIYASSKAGVLGSIAFWLVMLVMLYYVLYIWKKEKRTDG